MPAPPEIAAAAAAADADAVLLSDHDTLGARRAGHERYHGGTLVVVGHEISPRGGHMLAFGTEREIPHADCSEAQICAAITAAGGIPYAAHPFSEGSRISARIGRAHPWRTLEDCDCGVELWSLATDAAEACASVRELVRLLRRPEPVLDGPPGRHPCGSGTDCAQRGASQRWRAWTRTRPVWDRGARAVAAAPPARAYGGERTWLVSNPIYLRG